MIFEELQEIIVDKLGVDESEITMESSIKDDLKADSLDLFEIITGIEEQYDIEIPTDDLTGMTTVADMVAYIEKATQA